MNNLVTLTSHFHVSESEYKRQDNPYLYIIYSFFSSKTVKNYTFKVYVELVGWGMHNLEMHMWELFFMDHRICYLQSALENSFKNVRHFILHYDLVPTRTHQQVAGLEGN